LAAYEMNHFKAPYQKAVISNAKAFALALKENGLDVAGDPAISYTETHQVILNVGYSKGARVARELEDNHIIVNYQATPVEEGFTASGALRMGVSEMTRFGMGEKDFKALAALMGDLIKNGRAVKDEIIKFRQNFLDMQFCFKEGEFADVTGALLDSIK
jgi:aminomethyltransferase